MLRNWKMLGLYSLTVVVLSQPAPVVAQEDVKALAEKIDKLDKVIAKSFEGLTEDIKTLQANTLGNKLKVETLEGMIKKMEKDIEALKRRLEEPSSAPPLADKAGLEDIKAKLSAIEKAILGLTPTTARTALSPPTTSEGRVMFVNNYPEELLFILNGKNFRVPPLTSQPIDNVPAGTLSYEVLSSRWGLRARRTATLAAGETFTLTAQ